MAINTLNRFFAVLLAKSSKFAGDFHAYCRDARRSPGPAAERMAAWKALPQNAACNNATEARVRQWLWRGCRRARHRGVVER